MSASPDDYARRSFAMTGCAMLGIATTGAMVAMRPGLGELLHRYITEVLLFHTSAASSIPWIAPVTTTAVWGAALAWWAMLSSARVERFAINPLARLLWLVAGALMTLGGAALTAVTWTGYRLFFAIVDTGGQPTPEPLRRAAQAVEDFRDAGYIMLCASAVVLTLATLCWRCDPSQRPFGPRVRIARRGGIVIAALAAALFAFALLIAFFAVQISDRISATGGMPDPGELAESLSHVARSGLLATTVITLAGAAMLTTALIAPAHHRPQ